MPDPIKIRPATHPWCRVQILQVHYPALIQQWEKHWSNHGGWMWSARVVYLDRGECKTALIPAERVKRVG